MTTATCYGLKMPAEILTNIFKHALGNTVSADPTRLAISLVCKSWHRVLYENPSLWTNISLVYGPGPRQEVLIPDWSFLEQALDLAHPHPIDIKIRFDKWSETHPSNEELYSLSQIITVLQMHTIHWRSLVLCLPEDLMYAVLESECLESALSPGLQRVVLRGCNRFEDEHRSGTPITFSPQLRHLEINFYLLDLSPHWGNLQSLCMGFRNPLEAKTILMQAKNLSTLVITHVGPLEQATTVPPFKLIRVLDLSMSGCALKELHHILRCPHLGTLRFCGIAKQNHVNHMSSAGVNDDCPMDYYPFSKDMAEHAISIIDASQARISTLDASQRVIFSDAFLLLSRRIHDDLHTLALKGWYMQNENNKIFGSLMDVNVAPQLSSLEIENDHDSVVFCPLLEETIVARHRAGVLRRVRMERSTGVAAYYQTDGFGCLKFLDVCAQSSLAKTLSRLRREGLDVEWTVGARDILDLARKRMVTRF
ncbi:hypothetical protein CYLTODRAFT_423777 [Cylindrobasidium torrendii FP15055 ss-10]|uniref:F-box domain-containing protein n=1 Tax=Cylindrobasidium torrendii FP15055 ss-10 TaxID=1314674 RepID=A0A0D7B947_9AGAR|nr:hypothetical protein CYLTODRAFT_423777 [Cylindrobasidium torrendii FP15055 ss-10]